MKGKRRDRKARTSPLSASERRVLQRIVNRYEGARWSTQRSYIPAAVQSPRFDAGASTRLELVRKSRYFEKNNAIQNRMADLFECYTVGTNLQIHPATGDTQWDAPALDWFSGWSEVPDLTSRQNLGTLLSLCARTWFIDGEVFALKTRTAGNEPRLQLFEGHLCATPPQLSELEGERIIDGVQIDGSGRPVAYWIAEEDGRGNRTFTSRPAESVIHIFEPSRPGQYRGLPFCYPVINQLHDLDDLKILEMRAAKDAAERSNIVKTHSGELPDAELVRRANQLATQDLDGNLAVEKRTEALREALGGRSLALFPGEEFQQFEPKRPGDATRNYWRGLAEEICAGQGIPYVLVFPETMQGTVYRGALDMADAWFKARHLVLAAAAREIYEHAMDWARVAVPALRDPPGNWKAVTVHAPRAVNVDVGRQSRATLDELRGAVTTFEAVYGELGQNYRPQLRQKAGEARYLKELAREFGVSVAEICDLMNGQSAAGPMNPGNPVPPQPDPDDDDVRQPVPVGAGADPGEEDE